MFEEYGFPFPNDVICAFIGGSQLHGAKLGGTDDTDFYGVYVDPPEVRLGLDSHEHFVFSTNQDGARGKNVSTDVDVCLYSLSKFAGLVAKGNPSCLHFLFAPYVKVTDEWAQILEERSNFIARKHFYQFIGFANDQMRRLLGEKGGKDCNRPELDTLYGYDTKYAMHVIRLYGEAKELMETGIITLPRPNKDHLINIRRGKFKLAEIKDMGKTYEAEAQAAFEKSALPEKPDRQAISKLVATVYQQNWATRFYRNKGLTDRNESV